jgi:hypothetical protein
MKFCVGDLVFVGISGAPFYAEAARGIIAPSGCLDVDHPVLIIGIGTHGGTRQDMVRVCADVGIGWMFKKYLKVSA